MIFTRSNFIITMTLSTGILLTACSNDNNEKNQQAPLIASTPATGEASTLSERNAQQRLIQTLTAHFKKAGVPAKIIDVKNTEVPNLYWVNLEGIPSVYATNDGKYIIQGEIIRLGDKELHNVNEALQAEANKKIFANLNIEDLIVYKAKGKTKHVVYVFTDISCPYCHKLHEHMNEINAKGIEVRYIAWPRGEELFPAMENVWCNPNRQEAFNRAIAGEELESIKCKNPVRDQYNIGMNIGVNGTPAIYSEDGIYLGGYLAPEELNTRLNNK